MSCSQPQIQPAPPLAAQPLPPNSSAFLLPPTLREIIDAFNQNGNGDKDVLLAVLGAKKAEDERIASQIAYQSQAYYLAQQYPQVPYQHQHQHQLRINPPPTSAKFFSDPGNPSTPTDLAPEVSFPSPSSSSSSSSSSSLSAFSARSTIESERYSPYARPKDEHAIPLSNARLSFRSDKLAKIHYTLQTRRRSLSTSSASTKTKETDRPLEAPSSRPASSSPSSVTRKRILLNELLAPAQVTKTVGRESFVRGIAKDA